MSRLSIDQERAKYALNCRNEGMTVDKYGSHIESMPMMIHNSGLRNALAFAYSTGFLKDEGKDDKKADWKLLFEHLTYKYWFDPHKETTQFLLSKKPTDFDTKSRRDKASAVIEIFINLPDYEYRFVTQETISLLNWIRKLVKGD